ncbi:MAG: L-aspartate oxidase [Nitrososphaerota archaeon]
MTEVSLDIVIVGSGVGGLSAAAALVSNPLARGVKVGIVTKDVLDQNTTRFAQGGVATVLQGDEDSPDSHLADTIRAGAGLCDVDAVRVLVEEGPKRVERLIALGAIFDAAPDGKYLRALEGGHSKPRILHAQGTNTGAEIERALVEAVKQSAAAIFEGWFVHHIIAESNEVKGVVAMDGLGVSHKILADHVILASGGAGQVYSVTTNPVEATGDGLIAALLSGCLAADLEFVQFHPTALYHPAMPRPLLSEALRGHGAIIRDRHGNRFVDELAPRDEVSRAIAKRIQETDSKHVWLDARLIDDFKNRFPNIYSSLKEIGLDPKKDWLPIAPAAHYLCGGLATDLYGRTVLKNLWAVGETSCTGVHGANRLASNSLLEGLVFGARAVEAILSEDKNPEPSGVLRNSSEQGFIRIETTQVDPLCFRGDQLEDPLKTRAELQDAMTENVGVIRSATSLQKAIDKIIDLAGRSSLNCKTRECYETRNLIALSYLIANSARLREESRGSHTRSDFPSPVDKIYKKRFGYRGLKFVDNSL